MPSVGLSGILSSQGIQLHFTEMFLPKNLSGPLIIYYCIFEFGVNIQSFHSEH